MLAIKYFFKKKKLRHRYFTRSWVRLSVIRMFIKVFTFKQFVVWSCACYLLPSNSLLSEGVHVIWKVPASGWDNTKYCDTSNVQTRPKLNCGENWFVWLLNFKNETTSNHIRFSNCKRYLFYFTQLISFYTPWKDQKRGYRMRSLTWYGLSSRQFLRVFLLTL